MKLIEQTYLLLAKPRVVHSLPGRLRLSVPLLKQLDSNYHDSTKLLSALLEGVEGIENVSANRMSATILLHYDVKAVSREEILSFISNMSRVFVSQKDDMALLMEKDVDIIFRCLKDWLQRSIKRRLQLDINQRIVPDDFS